VLKGDTQRQNRSISKLWMEKLGENHPNTQTVWGNFVYLLQQAVEAGRAAELSDHPTTQAVLAQIQAEQRQ
jgi:hypothetical protein